MRTTAQVLSFPKQTHAYHSEGLFFCAILGASTLTGCKSNKSADLVVYDKIYTAEDNQIVEALAVKDGKFVYVGDKSGAEAFIEEGKTEIVDYSGKGR